MAPPLLEHFALLARLSPWCARVEWSFHVDSWVLLLVWFLYRVLGSSVGPPKRRIYVYICLFLVYISGKKLPIGWFILFILDISLWMVSLFFWGWYLEYGPPPHLASAFVYGGSKNSTLFPVHEKKQLSPKIERIYVEKQKKGALKRLSHFGWFTT